MFRKLQKTQWIKTSRWHGSPNQHWLWKLHTGLLATWILCHSTRPPDSGTLIYKLNATFSFIWKEDFGPLSNSPVLFLFSPGKMLLAMFLFQKCLVALFLKMSEHGDSWCTDSSFSLFLVKLSQVFKSALLDSILKLAVIPVACAHFLPNFFIPVNFAFNMLWYSTPWTATPFSNDPLWLTLFVKGVNDRLLDHCQVSSVPHYCGFKERDTQKLYCMDGHLLKLKCKYSNILRYWFYTFISCKL